MVRLLDILGALLVAELMGLANAKQSYQVVEFGNVGFSGTYKNVKKISNEDKDSCTCNLGDEIWFSGENAPLNEGVSVHFRGPLSLSKFAFYTSPSFDINDSSSSQSWNRTAYYDASNNTANNVTFLTKAGDNSSCLGKALTVGLDIPQYR
ncbi:YJL171Cp-like protein [Kluyveromyces marxianus]|uniref:glucan endo-1,3-beta-D-glucosidase n=1 Tax=Kluyveromyces marxianus TaxID=4911 RepID=A0ABX6F347_KLUMA|nr:YJL171Cp-like protein [Kluyveromyces marxianus]